jgi:hypothetical protein
VYLGTDFSGKKHNIISLLLAWFRGLATVADRLNLQTGTEKPFEKNIVGCSLFFLLHILFKDVIIITLGNGVTLRCNDKICTENSKQIFPKKELRSLSANFHIPVSVSDLYIPTIGLPILLQENTCGPILGIYESLTDTMNV